MRLAPQEGTLDGRHEGEEYGCDAERHGEAAGITGAIPAASPCLACMARAIRTRHTVLSPATTCPRVSTRGATRVRAVQPQPADRAHTRGAVPPGGERSAPVSPAICGSPQFGAVPRRGRVNHCTLQTGWRRRSIGVERRLLH